MASERFAIAAHADRNPEEGSSQEQTDPERGLAEHRRRLELRDVIDDGERTGAAHMQGERSGELAPIP